MARIIMARGQSHLNWVQCSRLRPHAAEAQYEEPVATKARRGSRQSSNRGCWWKVPLDLKDLRVSVVRQARRAHLGLPATLARGAHLDVLVSLAQTVSLDPLEPP